MGGLVGKRVIPRPEGRDRVEQAGLEDGVHAREQLARGMRPFYFATRFRTLTGLTPSGYRAATWGPSE